MQEIFTTVKISNNKEVVIYEGNGLNLFTAMSKAKGDTGIMLKNLILQLVTINGIRITEDELDQMPIKDVSYLCEVMGTMMANNFLNGI